MNVPTRRAAAHRASAAAALVVVAVALAGAIVRPVAAHTSGTVSVPSRGTAVEATSGFDGPVPAYVGAVVRSGAELATGRSTRGAIEIAALASALLIAATRRRAGVALAAHATLPCHTAVPCASRAPPLVLAS